jgi:aquaporin Z
MRKPVAEFMATFALLFAILECILLCERAAIPGLTLVASSIVAGAAVTLLILQFGTVSGAHMNPGVSISLWMDKQLTTGLMFGYVFAQLSGSFLAALVIDLLHGEGYHMGTTDPAMSMAWVWILEFGLTFALMGIIYLFSDHRYPARNKWAAVVIGLTVTLEIFFAGEYSGASMNPARSFGPALISGKTEFLWIYLTAPVAGAIAAWSIKTLFARNKPT